LEIWPLYWNQAGQFLSFPVDSFGFEASCTMQRELIQSRTNPGNTIFAFSSPANGISCGSYGLSPNL
jgi:hypothetical protein